MIDDTYIIVSILKFMFICDYFIKITNNGKNKVTRSERSLIKSSKWLDFRARMKNFPVVHRITNKAAQGLAWMLLHQDILLIIISSANNNGMITSASAPEARYGNSFDEEGHEDANQEPVNNLKVTTTRVITVVKLRLANATGDKSTYVDQHYVFSKPFELIIINSNWESIRVRT